MSAAIDQIADRLNRSIETGDWQRADGELNVIARRFTAELVRNGTQLAETLYSIVQKLHGRLTAQVDLSPEGRVIEGQLRYLTAMFTYALQLRRPAPLAEMAASETYRDILEALFWSAEPLSGGQLANKVGCASETISRKLSDLRAAGMTTWIKAGRVTFNKLTEAGGKECAAAFAANAPAAEKVLDDYFDKIVTISKQVREVTNSPAFQGNYEPVYMTPPEDFWADLPSELQSESVSLKLDPNQNYVAMWKQASEAPMKVGPAKG